MYDAFRIQISIVAWSIGLVLVFLTVSHQADNPMSPDKRLDHLEQQAHVSEIGLKDPRTRSSQPMDSHIAYSGFDFSTTPSDHIQGLIETCYGNCTFLLTFGQKAVLMSRNIGGQITSAQIISRSEELEADLTTIDMSDVGIDLQRFPILSLSNRVFGFFETSDRETAIIEGTVSSKQVMKYGGGSVSTADSCTETRVNRNVSCTDQGNSYYTEWTECDQVSCPDGRITFTNCEPKSVTIPRDVMHAGVGGPSGRGCN